MRKVILHYHLFKNAGTSLDAAFKENFSEEKDEWVTKEFPNQPAENRKQVRQWILDNPQAKCFSSHTALFPVPEVEGVDIFPVIFVRHPLDRIASAYSFERRQDSDSFGSVLAKNTNLKGYVDSRLALPFDKQCRNFHCSRFAPRGAIQEGEELTAALVTLERLPFVGLVESFELSIEKLENELEDFGVKGVNLSPKRANVSRKTLKLEDKLIQMEEELGSHSWEKLISENSADLALFEKIKQKYYE